MEEEERGNPSSFIPILHDLITPQPRRAVLTFHKPTVIQPVKTYKKPDTLNLHHERDTRFLGSRRLYLRASIDMYGHDIKSRPKYSKYAKDCLNVPSLGPPHPRHVPWYKLRRHKAYCNIWGFCHHDCAYCEVIMTRNKKDLHTHPHNNQLSKQDLRPKRCLLESRLFLLKDRSPQKNTDVIVIV